MGPKLKENSPEWLMFTGGLCFAALLATALLFRAHRINARASWWCVVVVAAVLLLTLLKPCLARPVYRAGMTLGFYLGQIVSRVLLTVMFLLVLTPLGVLLRLFGKDLLLLKRRTDQATYWQEVKTKSDLKRQF